MPAQAAIAIAGKSPYQAGTKLRMQVSDTAILRRLYGFRARDLIVH